MAKIKVKKKGEVTYPADHKVGMKVPLNGSDCAKCEYLEKGICVNENFIKWNGTGVLPEKPNEYCCDFFETA